MKKALKMQHWNEICMERPTFIKVSQKKFFWFVKAKLSAKSWQIHFAFATKAMENQQWQENATYKQHTQDCFLKFFRGRR